MNDIDIVLVNIIIFMGGVFSGMGFCFRYKNRLLARSRSQEFRNNPLDLPPVNQEPAPPPVYPTAPVPMALGYPNSPQRKEIVIRTVE